MKTVAICLKKGGNSVSRRVLTLGVDDRVVFEVDAAFRVTALRLVRRNGRRSTQPLAVAVSQQRAELSGLVLTTRGWIDEWVVEAKTADINTDSDSAVDVHYRDPGEAAKWVHCGSIYLTGALHRISTAVGVLVSASGGGVCAALLLQRTPWSPWLHALAAVMAAISMLSILAAVGLGRTIRWRRHPWLFVALPALCAIAGWYVLLTQTVTVRVATGSPLIAQRFGQGGLWLLPELRAQRGWLDRAEARVVSVEQAHRCARVVEYPSWTRGVMAVECNHRWLRVNEPMQRLFVMPPSANESDPECVDMAPLGCALDPAHQTLVGAVRGRVLQVGGPRADYNQLQRGVWHAMMTGKIYLRPQDEAKLQSQDLATGATYQFHVSSESAVTQVQTRQAPAGVFTLGTSVEPYSITTFSITTVRPQGGIDFEILTREMGSIAVHCDRGEEHINVIAAPQDLVHSIAINHPASTVTRAGYEVMAYCANASDRFTMTMTLARGVRAAMQAQTLNLNRLQRLAIPASIEQVELGFANESSAVALRLGRSRCVGERMQYLLFFSLDPILAQQPRFVQSIWYGRERTGNLSEYQRADQDAPAYGFLCTHGWIRDREHSAFSGLRAEPIALQEVGRPSWRVVVPQADPSDRADGAARIERISDETLTQSPD